MGRERGVALIEVSEDTSVNARKRFPDEILHRNEILAIGFAEIEDAAHVAVGDPRCNPRLVEEHLDVLLFVGEMRVDPLERHELLEARVPFDPRQVDARHSTRGQLEAELVAADLRRRIRAKPSRSSACRALGVHVFGARILHQTFRQRRPR